MNMRKIVTILSVIMVSAVLMFAVNSIIYADSVNPNGLTDEENAAFITRDEFNIWVESFTASLSELDMNATKRIYSDMDFYDMQYRFTERYKTSEFMDGDKENAKLKRMIAIEKAKRGLS